MEPHAAAVDVDVAAVNHVYLIVKCRVYSVYPPPQIEMYIQGAWDDGAVF